MPPSNQQVKHATPCLSLHGQAFVHGGLLVMAVQVGVVDILPTCLSSVYCFYDPDFRHFSLGKLTALMEIKWVQQASRFRPDLRYYYLGFYIHNCQKMKYKGDYAPSELLCPETRSVASLSHPTPSPRHQIVLSMFGV